MAEVTALARRYKFQVDLNYPGGSPDWVDVKGLTDFGPNVKPNNEDASTYDTDGWNSYEKTMQGWSVEATFLRRKDDADEAYDEGQEKLRAAMTGFGQDCRVQIRWYDRDGGSEAYQGVGILQWERANSGVADLDAAKVTIMGDGALTTISNPEADDADPTVTSISPTTGDEAGGDLVTINGSGFATVTGATGVKFGGTNAASYVVVDAGTIVAVSPAGSGTVQVSVTNPNGTSANTAADDFTYA